MSPQCRPVPIQTTYTHEFRSKLGECNLYPRLPSRRWSWPDTRWDNKIQQSHLKSTASKAPRFWTCALRHGTGFKPTCFQAATMSMSCQYVFAHTLLLSQRRGGAPRRSNVAPGERGSDGRASPPSPTVVSGRVPSRDAQRHVQRERRPRSPGRPARRTSLAGRARPRQGFELGGLDGGLSHPVLTSTTRETQHRPRRDPQEMDG